MGSQTCVEMGSDTPRRGPCCGPLVNRSGTALLAKPAGVGGDSCDGASCISAMPATMPDMAVSSTPPCGTRRDLCAAFPCDRGAVADGSGAVVRWSTATDAALRNMEWGPVATAHSTGILSKPKRTRQVTSARASLLAGLACRHLACVTGKPCVACVSCGVNPFYVQLVVSATIALLQRVLMSLIRRVASSPYCTEVHSGRIGGEAES